MEISKSSSVPFHSPDAGKCASRSRPAAFATATLWSRKVFGRACSIRAYRDMKLPAASTRRRGKLLFHLGRRRIVHRQRRRLLRQVTSWKGEVRSGASAEEE